MKVRLTFEQMRAIEITTPVTDPDEIYVAYMVHIARKEDDKTAKAAPYAAAVSPVQHRITKGTVFEPKLAPIDIDLGDATGITIEIAAYEEDDGKIHAQLAREITSFSAAGFDWESIDLPDDLTSVGDWVKALFSAIKALVNFVTADDLLRVVQIPIDTTRDGWEGLREYEFKNYGGDYRLAIRLAKV